MTTDLFDLTGKVALVTGASRGICAETAKLLAEQGGHVIVSSRKIEGCQAVGMRSAQRVVALKPSPVMWATWKILTRFFRIFVRSMAGWISW